VTAPETLWASYVERLNLTTTTVTVSVVASKGRAASYDCHWCPDCGALISHDIDGPMLYVDRRSWDNDPDWCPCESVTGSWDTTQMEDAHAD
jgi:hypothetical protein